MEIGGHNIPSDVIFNVLGIKKYVCVDFISGYWGEGTSQQAFVELATERQDYAAYMLEQANSASVLQSHSYLKFDGMPKTFLNHFTGNSMLLFPQATFEHVQNLPAVVEQILPVFAQRRFILYKFFPDMVRISWTSLLDGLRTLISLKIKRGGGIPPWIHLLWSEKQVRQHFTEYPLPYGEKHLKH